jgi:hypothetical protein
LVANPVTRPVVADVTAFLESSRGASASRHASCSSRAGVSGTRVETLARRGKQGAAARASAGVAGGDDAVLVGEHDRLHPVAEAEFEQDAADVALDGRLGDDQPLGDLAV